jgi:hypothetical protein
MWRRAEVYSRLHGVTFHEIALVLLYNLVFQGKDIGTAVEPSVDVPHTAPNTSEDPGIPVDELLLPRDITPSYYRLRLDPYLEDPSPDGSNFTYKGHVSITIHCHNATNRVSFHAKNLEIGDDINITLSNETSTKTTASSILTSSASTSAPTSTAGHSNTTSDAGGWMYVLCASTCLLSWQSEF